MVRNAALRGFFAGLVAAASAAAALALPVGTHRTQCFEGPATGEIEVKADGTYAWYSVCYDVASEELVRSLLHKGEIDGEGYRSTWSADGEEYFGSFNPEKAEVCSYSWSGLIGVASAEGGQIWVDETWRDVEKFEEERPDEVPDCAPPAKESGAEPGPARSQ